MKSLRNHKNKRRSNRNRTKRLLAVDPNCWGKNEPLEQLWRDLSSFLSVVIVYKGRKPYEIIEIQSNDSTPVNISNLHNKLSTFDADPSVVAILSANPDTKNVYETVLYPRARDKTVDYVITNYTKFFKRIPNQPIKKRMAPY